MSRASWIIALSFVFSLSARAALYDPDHVQVYLVPLSDFPEPLSVQLAKVLSEDLGFWVKSSLRIGKLGVEHMPGTNQLPAEEVMAKAQETIKTFPEASEGTHFVLLTMQDINSQHRGFRFQFSMHDKALKTSVISMARLLDYKAGKAILNDAALSRLFKMSKRAIGEMLLGWHRSTDRNDVMYSPLMSVQDLDRIGAKHIEPDEERRGSAKAPDDQGAI